MGRRVSPTEPISKLKAKEPVSAKVDGGAGSCALTLCRLIGKRGRGEEGRRRKRREGERAERRRKKGRGGGEREGGRGEREDRERRKTQLTAFRSAL